jgi:hypothetical protein
VTCRSHRMQKQKCDVTCPITIFVESVLVPPKHENRCVDISRLGRTEVHYLTRRSHRRKKNNFGTMCPEVLFVCRHFAPRMHRNALCDVQIPPDAKTKVQCNMSHHNFVESVPVPPKHEKLCVDISHLGRTGMHLVTRRFLWMRKTQVWHNVP